MGEVSKNSTKVYTQPAFVFLSFRSSPLYQLKIPFNNGIYDEESSKSVSEDKRSILYWNPYLENKSGEPTIVQWYNNDDAKNFRVMVIGFDENNDLLYYNEVLK